MKRIVTLQDISCLGRCSLTVALPVISAMGWNVPWFPRRCCPPTPCSRILPAWICGSDGAHCPPLEDPEDWF